MLSEDYCVLAQAAKAIPYTRRLVTLDPLNESFHRQLMQVYVQAGQHTAALKQYKICQQILRKEIGIDPQPETYALYQQIRKGKIKPFQLEKSSQKIVLHHNIPLALSSFIGREKEQQEIVDLIAYKRLITLTGVGGVGKTRLALEVSEKLLDDYADGVWLVELASLNDPTLVDQTVAGLFNVTPQAERDLAASVVDALKAKTLLIILDNCEHVLEACAQLADMFLRNCPQVKIMTTSRQPLGVTGEVSYQVQPLSVPDVHQVESFDRLVEYDAIRLFDERACLSLVNFSITKESINFIVQICRCLDGIPLAIELAAARVKVMSVQQIARRLNNRFNLLKTDSPVALRRHQALRTAIDWSYDLLNEEESILFRRLAVFSGSWSLEGGTVAVLAKIHAS